MRKKYCLAVDLKDDDVLIKEYEQYHKKIPAAIQKSIADAGIESMEIYRAGNRLFMIMEATETFSFEKKAVMDNANEAVQNWEDLMWKFQQSLPFAKPGEKWILMSKIFEL